MYLHAIDNFKVIAEIHVLATTSCKNVETLSRKNDLSCFKSLLVTGLLNIILTSLLPPIQSCSSKFWAWSCIASNFDKGWRGDHKHKIMDRPFMPKYGTVSQVLLQLVVALCTVFNFPFVYFYGTATKWILWNKAVWWLVYLVFDWGKFIYDYVSRLSQQCWRNLRCFWRHLLHFKKVDLRWTCAFLSVLFVWFDLAPEVRQIIMLCH